MQYEIEYLGGYPAWAYPSKVITSIDKNSVWFKERGFLSAGRSFSIKKDLIIDISYEKGGNRSALKTVGSALVGGVLTGGIGFLVGGALGARKKNNSELYITYKYNDRELVLSLKTGKNTDNVYSMINSLFI